MISAALFLALVSLGITEGTYAVNKFPRWYFGCPTGYIQSYNGCIPEAGSPKGSISGYIYNDANKNLQRDPNEQIIGATVHLKTLSGIHICSVTTQDDGKYSFNQLADGTYRIKVTNISDKLKNFKDRDPNANGVSIVKITNEKDVQFIDFSYIFDTDRYIISFMDKEKVSRGPDNVIGAVYKIYKEDRLTRRIALSGVLVRLVSNRTGSTIGNCITDRNGRYQFVTRPGWFDVIIAAGIPRGLISAWESDNIPDGKVQVRVGTRKVTIINFEYSDKILQTSPTPSRPAKSSVLLAPTFAMTSRQTNTPVSHSTSSRSITTTISSRPARSSVPLVPTVTTTSRQISTPLSHSISSRSITTTPSRPARSSVLLVPTVVMTSRQTNAPVSHSTSIRPTTTTPFRPTRSSVPLVPTVATTSRQINTPLSHSISSRSTTIPSRPTRSSILLVPTVTMTSRQTNAPVSHSTSSRSTTTIPSRPTRSSVLLVSTVVITSKQTDAPVSHSTSSRSITTTPFRPATIPSRPVRSSVLLVPTLTITSRQTTTSISYSTSSGSTTIIIPSINPVISFLPAPAFDSLQPQESQGSSTLGSQGSGSIAGAVFQDRDCNKRASKEEGIPQATITLKAKNGTVLSTTVTDNTGGYLFKDVDIGTYEVVVSLINGYVPYSDADPTDKEIDGLTKVVLAPADDRVHGVDFQFVASSTGATDPSCSPKGTIPSPSLSLTQSQSSSSIISVDSFQPQSNSFRSKPAIEENFAKISGILFIDVNGNEAPDEGEGIEGITLLLVNDNNNILSITSTRPDGHYSFTNLHLSYYRVVMVAKSVPSSYTLLSDPSGDHNGVFDVVLTKDNKAVNANFRFYVSRLRAIESAVSAFMTTARPR